MTPPPPASLRAVIAEEIRCRGPLPFSRYMELCLYHPELGFYARAQEQFGKAGDFYTASDVHAVFGRLLARQFEEMWRALDAPARLELIELGPGRGLFALDVLAWSAKCFPEFARALRYTLVERSATLRQKLAARLAEPLAAGQARVVASLAELAPADAAIVFANEFFDALPVEVLAPAGELRINLREGAFVEEFVAARPESLAFVDRYGVQPEAEERVEAAPAYGEQVRAVAGAMRRGFAVWIDYGYTRAELLAGRHRGTVTAYRRHTVSASPYEAPGEQDITAHVNFTALAALAEENGMEAQPLVTQSQFLLGIGESNQFADAFAECGLPQEHTKVALQLKHLLTPAGMGETFQVLVVAKGVAREQAARLSGLMFGKTRA